MTWKSYAVVSGAGILATYLASPPLLPERQPAVPAVQNARAADSSPEADILREAARLEARMRAEAAFRAPARNPFRFGAPRTAVRPPAVEPAQIQAAAIGPPPEPEPPFIVLSGIATDVIDGTTERTAVLTTASGVVLAGVGDLVGTDYRVRAIQDDGVDLESTRDGAIRQLRFPPPPPE